jgi:tetratricopeptide (TPR) repeat protein
VAQQLDIILLDQDRTWSNYIPTNSTEAHNLVLQGEAAGTYHDAIPFYEKAIKRDPNYVKAYGELAWAHTDIYWRNDRSPERLVAAEVAARRALALLPDHPWVQLIMARYYFHGHLDYESTLKHLGRACELHPNRAWTLYWTGAVQRRQGDFQQALVNLRRAFDLNPLNARFAYLIGDTLKVLREYPEAEHYYELAIAGDPNNEFYYTQKAWLYLIWQGDLSEARDVIDEGSKNIDTVAYPRIYNLLMVTIDMWEEQYQDALERLSQEQDVSEPSIWTAPKALRQAEIYTYLNKEAVARQYYESARSALEDKVRESPDMAHYHSFLGLAFAGLGDKEKAIEHGELGTEYLPVTMDALGGPRRLEDLARIYVMVGKYDEAIDKLDDLLNMPGNLSLALLKLDPAWKPLHNHPRFKKLIESDK